MLKLSDNQEYHIYRDTDVIGILSSWTWTNKLFFYLFYYIFTSYIHSLHTYIIYLYIYILNNQLFLIQNYLYKYILISLIIIYL